MGTAIARMLTTQGIGVRLIEPDRERAREVAEELPACRVYSTTGIDADFLERERIGRAQAAVFAIKEDAKNHYAATLARVHGVRFTIAIVHDAISTPVYELSGVDVTINPRGVTAEEIVRFAHDPRTQQVAMLEGDRYEVLDITTQPTSEYVGLRFREMPIRGALIGAIVRDGHALFPRSDEVLQAGDRVIVFTERSRVPDGREGALSPYRAARIGARARLGIDLAGALGLTGTLLAYLSLSALLPAAAAIGYGEPVWPFLAAGGITGGIGLGLARLGRRRTAAPIGFREGYLVVSLTWLLAPVYASLPYLFSDEPQLSHPVDALFEGMSGFTTTGASVVADVEALDRLDPPLATAEPVDRRDGDHRARARGAPAASDRRPPDVRVGAPGARGRPARRADP